ncbi:HPF/RaiA family ribosome-associated protein [Taibaiella lutea]|uniref:HPF/RaiA family ribosome-associated protein n=1 Tax=Taibaiella lutea TaxID=2608001 RepID=A0A5M6CAZ0_9BACT|nr:HPF/RaiA family ribosome-associated protein [Taibaiella lutea]KAA5532348.1 HPF/RaiA family ribosome-associated protein [Taibaiella lutea]
MTIQLNADKNLVIHEAFGAELRELLSKELSHFSEHITRLEVHLSDKNGRKIGPNDKRCMLEARIESKQPIAVSADGNTHEISVKAASDKLKHALDSIMGKAQNH